MDAPLVPSDNGRNNGAEETQDTEESGCRRTYDSNLDGPKLFPLKNRQHGTLQDGEISQLMDAHLVPRDNDCDNGAEAMVLMVTAYDHGTLLFSKLL